MKYGNKTRMASKSDINNTKEKYFLPGKFT